MPNDMCRCGTCGRFTGHWRYDESFCGNIDCQSVDENGDYSRRKIKFCTKCKIEMKEDARGESNSLRW